jgi:hypothetical protein
MNETIEKLSPKQKQAYIKTMRFLKPGVSIIEATRKAKVKTSDFNNARARISQINKTTKNFVTLTTEDLNRFESFIAKALTAITKRVRR